MKIAGAAVLVMGADRGLGRAPAEETLRRGAKRVYAGTRKLLAHSDARVTPFALEAANDSQIQRDGGCIRQALAGWCPVCITTAVLMAGGVAAAGGLAERRGQWFHSHPSKVSASALSQAQKLRYTVKGRRAAPLG
jgi:NAD(P)-dependent dehydrogenase (short-subunit alcohol dehydrogenase family)